MYLFLGPEIPQKCTGASSVTAPNGEGIVLLGCYDYGTSESIYSLESNGTHLNWELLPQKIRHSRSRSVAMLIPDELANCSLWNIF